MVSVERVQQYIDRIPSEQLEGKLMVKVINFCQKYLIRFSIKITTEIGRSLKQRVIMS